jgi:hypothetical protein
MQNGQLVPQHRDLDILRIRTLTHPEQRHQTPQDHQPDRPRHHGVIIPGPHRRCSQAGS